MLYHGAQAKFNEKYLDMYRGSSPGADIGFWVAETEQLMVTIKHFT